MEGSYHDNWTRSRLMWLFNKDIIKLQYYYYYNRLEVTVGFEPLLAYLPSYNWGPQVLTDSFSFAVYLFQ